MSAPTGIDWALAERVAAGVSGRPPRIDAAERRRVWADLLEASARAEAIVSEHTGLVPTAPTEDPVVLGRAAWVSANIRGLSSLADRMMARLEAPAPTRRVAATALGLELGTVLGWVSKRVLGQYDLFGATGRVYYIGPNVVEFERRFDLDPKAFRLWIALHEVTHRVQFAAVDWLPGHVNDLLARITSTIEMAPGTLQRVSGRVMEVVAAGPDAWRTTNLMDLLATEEQRSLLDEVRALMSVVEGHASWVMNRAAVDEVLGLERMKQAVEHRREAAGGIVPRLMGMRWKMEQYALGEDFLAAVEERTGREGVNVVWRSPADLPTMQELRDPEAWLARTGT